jgi:hypothetical protein
VFEDHQGAEDDSALDVKKARQVATHPNWMRENVEASSGAVIIPVLVTPVVKAKEAALPHLNEVSLWPLGEFRAWAERAFATLRELRSSFLEPGNLIWRAQAAEAFEENGLDASGLAARLKEQRAKELLRSVK